MTASFEEQLREEWLEPDELTDVADRLMTEMDEDDRDGEYGADIEEIAHACRAEYLGRLSDEDPELYLRGAAGVDAHIRRLMDEETGYADAR